MLRLGSHPIHTWMTACRCVACTLTGPERGDLINADGPLRCPFKVVLKERTTGMHYIRDQCVWLSG